jgi:hypothetical protein
MTITIHKIAQAEANSLMEQLSGEALDNFKLGFHDEKDNIVMNIKPIALPQKDRSYFLIKVDTINYLLVGINLNPDKTLNLSSYARITTKLNGKASSCLKQLIEQELVPLCHSLAKGRILSLAYTQRSTKVFEKLTRLQIKGVKDVKLNGNKLSVIIEKQN